MIRTSLFLSSVIYHLSSIIRDQHSARHLYGLAFLLGSLAALAMPPVFALPLLPLSFTALYVMIAHAATRKRALLIGWWWGLGYFMTGLYWISIAMTTDIVKFGWLIPFVLVGLNGVLALHTALAALCVRLLKPAATLAGAGMFACVWTAVEYLRGHWFTGFPWNLPGYAWAFSDSASQMVSFIGIYGLSFLTALASVAPVTLLAPKRNWLAPLTVWTVVVALIALGHMRLSQADEVPQAERYVPGVTLRLVQANISKHHKWVPEMQIKALQKHMDLTLSPGSDRVTHVIWPETAVPFVLNRDAKLISLLRSITPPGGVLITGAIRAEGADEQFSIWNSLVAITGSDGIVSAYDKHHLVPFGEFIPLRNMLPIDRVVPGPTDFARGPGPATLAIPGAPAASPLICYEAIFPGEAVDAARRPGWLLNVTNDAWFGISSGPYQHLHMARFRAIEQGLPLVRVANTGISAVTDAYGRVLQRLPLGTEGVLDAPLPKPLRQGTTYSSIVNIFTTINK